MNEVLEGVPLSSLRPNTNGESKLGCQDPSSHALSHCCTERVIVGSGQSSTQVCAVRFVEESKREGGAQVDFPRRLLCSQMRRMGDDSGRLGIYDW